LTFGELRQVVLVIVVLNVSLLGLFAIVYGCLDLGLYHGHLGDDTLDLHELVHKGGFQTSGCHIILAKVSLKIHVICLYFLWEMDVRALYCQLLLVLFTTILLQSSHCLVELVLEDFDCLKWFPGNVSTQSAVEFPHFVDVDVESLSSPNHASDSVVHMGMFFTKPLLKVLNFQIIDYFDLISVPFRFLIGSFKYIPRFQIKGD
jgi:hypothetical protein